MEKFKAKNTKVLLVRHENVELSRQFLEQEKCTLDMLVDTKREVYHFFGMGRSMNHALGSLKSMEFYIKGIVETGKYPGLTNLESEVPEDVDLFQMAGDFLLNKQGKLVWLYRAAGATLRPTVEEILQVIPADAE